MVFIDDVSNCGQLHGDPLKTYLESKVQETENDVTIEALNDLVRKDLQICRNDSNARSRVENLVTSYVSILPRSGLAWVIKEDQGSAL